MPLNLNALQEAQADLVSRTSGNQFFTSKNLKEETDVRVLPPLANLQGIYYFEEQGYWINKKRYTSPKTFGHNCPIEEEVEAARKLNDPTIDKLLDSQRYSSKSVFYLPMLVLNTQFGEKGECISCDVDGSSAKIFQTSVTMIKAINKIATNRQFQNGTEDGVFDRVKGYNMILTKVGSGIDTEYGAIGWNTPMEMDEKYYKEIPDVRKLVEDKLKSDEYLRSVIRNYLYGEKILEEQTESTQETNQESNSNPEPIQSATSRAPSRAPSREENSRPTTTSRTTQTVEQAAPVESKSQSRGSSILDDIRNMD